MSIDCISDVRQREIAERYLMNCDGLVSAQQVAQDIGKHYGLTADEVLALVKKFEDTE